MDIQSYCFSEHLNHHDDFYLIALNEKYQHRKLQNKSDSNFNNRLATLALFKNLLGLPTQTYEVDIYRTKIQWWQQQLNHLSGTSTPDRQISPYGIDVAVNAVHPLIHSLLGSPNIEQTVNIAKLLLEQLESPPVIHDEIRHPIIQAFGHSTWLALNGSTQINVVRDNNSIITLLGYYWFVKHRIWWKVAALKNLSSADQFNTQKQQLKTLMNELAEVKPTGSARSKAPLSFTANTRIYLRLIQTWLASNKAVKNNQSTQFEPGAINKLYQYWRGR